MKTSKPTKSAQPSNTTNDRDSINWQARYYQDKARKFFESASYSAPSEAIIVTTTKREVKAVLKAADKVRHNRAYVPAKVSKYVMIAGVPHKYVDGALVALTAKVA